ncbi:IpaC/SipC family type III secretion system effector [Sodalis sp. RH16]|uniref:IpaC/SipC family type III secretion system effector n=1 Tax=unclassified Sodalis (in: enterobacteria) TaxID=2636512 RepID=UPI0039B5B4C7
MSAISSQGIASSVLNQEALTANAQTSNAEANGKPISSSQSFAGIVTDKMLDSLLGTGAAVTLRHPDSAGRMPVKELHAQVEKMLERPDLLQVLEQRAAEGTEKKEVKKEFDISKLTSSNIAAIFAEILKALQANKTAENNNKGDMAILKGQMTAGAAEAIIKSGQTALNGAIGQAAFGTAISGAGFSTQQKGLAHESQVLKNNNRDIVEKKFTLENDRMNFSRSGTSTPDSAMDIEPPRFNNADGQNFVRGQSNETAKEAYGEHVKDGARFTARENEINHLEIDMKDEMAKAEKIKNLGMFMSQMNHPVTGITAGQTQAIQASENAQQHILQQVGHAADGLGETSSANSRDFESLLQTIAQKLAEIIRAHLDTAGMIAGKSV